MVIREIVADGAASAAAAAFEATEVHVIPAVD